MSELIDRARESLRLWDGADIEMFVRCGYCDAETAYRQAPELVTQLIAEIERLEKRAIPETVTRIDVIRPLRNEFWSDHWAVAIQDGGRTVKLFAEGDGRAANEERNAALAKDISEDMRKLGGRS